MKGELGFEFYKSENEVALVGDALKILERYLKQKGTQEMYPCPNQKLMFFLILILIPMHHGRRHFPAKQVFKFLRIILQHLHLSSERSNIKEKEELCIGNLSIDLLKRKKRLYLQFFKRNKIYSLQTQS